MSDDVNLLDYAWGKILGGSLLLGLAFWLNADFKDIETGVKESVRMNWMFVLLYQNLGRQWTVALTGVAGAFSLILGLRQLLSERK